MSDWQVGDLAVCIDDGPCECCGDAHPGLKRGLVYTVTSLYLDPTWEEELFLQLAELPDLPSLHHPERGNWADAASFRKVQHDSREACEEEFRILLKLSKQRVSA